MIRPNGSSNMALTEAKYGRLALSPLLAYALALAVAGVALGVREALDPLLGSQLPFSTPFIAVLLAAWYCGRGPALATLFAGAVGAAFFFIEPRHAVESVRPRSANRA